ncbi:MAG TPA: FxsA family protein, partial [Rhodospirillales bacterium]|nr:FxsA family protein [Rhodospirillales bacterium]
MGLVLFAVMIVVPILEIAVFILVGRYIGLWPTLAGIVLTALIGTVIIRHQGIGLIAAARKSIAAGEAPIGEALQGLALLVAGALLITPGFITDTLGFLFLV